ncbi:hypothetical protein [uncultured Clostridium sp.]|uniref:hypothetical protein n=1 Tax=uncultured Clostridium sp. TaxID=59620 RepID=UPI00321692EA
MKDLVLKCFFSNSVEGGKLQVEELDLEEDEKYINFRVNIINNKIRIYNNGIIRKEYVIKKTKVLYESIDGNELVIEYEGKTTRFII